MSHISDLVRDSWLSTQFLPDHTIHTLFESSVLPKSELGDKGPIEQTGTRGIHIRDSVVGKVRDSRDR